MRIASYLLGFVLIAATGCGKSTPPAAATTAATTAATAAATQAAAPDTTAPAAPETVAAATVAAEDAAVAAPDDVAAVEAPPYIRVVVANTDTAKPTVIAEFKKFELVEANVDLTKLETAKAVIDIDIDSFSSGDATRDADVKMATLLDVAKFPKATLTVDHLKAAAAVDGKEAPKDTYDATAKLEMHGVSKEFPVTFKVVETKPDGAIVIEGETKGLARADWGVTADPAKSGVAPTFDAQVRLELRNVSAPLTTAESDELKGLFTKMLDHQEAVLKILEENKDDVAKAATALEAYIAKNGEELKKITADGKTLADKGGREAMMKIVDGVKDRLQGAMSRLQALSQSSPKLLADERIKKAMSAFGGQ